MNVAVGNTASNPYGPWTSPEVINESLNNAFREANSQIVAQVLDDNVLDNQPILEVGAGLGALGDIIPAKYTSHYVQSDRTPLYAQMSQRRNKQLSTVAADIDHLPMRDASIGTVVAMDVFDMLDDGPQAAAEIHRTLMDGGSFIHLHDRRPNIEHIKKIIHREPGTDAETVALLPVIENDTLTRLRMIRRDTLSIHAAKLSIAEQQLLQAYVSDGHNLSLARSVRPQEVEAVARMAAQMPGQITPSFGELFLDDTFTLFENAGFKDVKAGFLQAQAVVDYDRVKYLFNKQTLERLKKQGGNMPANVLTNDKYGKLLFRDHHTGIPKGKLLQSTVLSVLVAHK